MAIEKRTPGLNRTLKALGVWGWTQDHQMHGGAADGVKCLAGLAGLLGAVEMEEVKKGKKGVGVFCYSPKVEGVRFSGRWHEYTARISAVDRGKLLDITPDGLFTLCAKYAGLLGVGLNSKTEALFRGPVRKWWVSFENREALEDFTREFDESEVYGVRVRVDKDKRVEGVMCARRCLEGHKVTMMS